jgi:hypothetical protein
MEEDVGLVQSTSLWLKEALEHLSVESFLTIANLSDILPSQTKDEARTLADQLWEPADEIENPSAAVTILLYLFKSKLLLRLKTPRSRVVSLSIISKRKIGKNSSLSFLFYPLYIKPFPRISRVYF